MIDGCFRHSLACTIEHLRMSLAAFLHPEREMQSTMSFMTSTFCQIFRFKSSNEILRRPKKDFHFYPRDVVRIPPIHNFCSFIESHIFYNEQERNKRGCLYPFEKRSGKVLQRSADSMKRIESHPSKNWQKIFYRP